MARTLVRALSAAQALIVSKDAADAEELLQQHHSAGKMSPKKRKYIYCAGCGGTTWASDIKGDKCRCGAPFAKNALSFINTHSWTKMTPTQVEGVTPEVPWLVQPGAPVPAGDGGEGQAGARETTMAAAM